MIAVVDYGMGNLHSMAKAIEHIGEDATVTSNPAVLEDAERIVLPGRRSVRRVHDQPARLGAG